MTQNILKNYVVEALQSLRLFKLRSALALLGILVGSASIVALVSSSQLATQHALAQFTQLGTDLYAISLQSSSGASSDETKNLRLSQVAILKTSSPNIVSVAPYVTDYSPITYAGKPIPGSLIGATEALNEIMKIELAAGRFISHLDHNEYYCVVGSEIAAQIQRRGGDPLGKQIRVGDRYFTIFGVAKPWRENMFLLTDINNSVIVPIETALALNKYTHIQNLVFKFVANSNNESAQKNIQAKLHQLLPEMKWFARSAKELITGMQAQRQTFTILLGAIGGISLIVGGIGVMNVMLVAVVERRREIGIRMAVGAKRSDIQRMFLVESVVLTLTGGLLGVVVGELISLLIALLSHWGFSIFFLPLLVGFGVSVLIGVFFGYYPAYQASRLNPIEALRAE